MHEKKTLYLLVEDFTNDTRESFFEKELPYLCKVFKQVNIIPLYPDNTVLNYQADNINVLSFNFFEATNRMSILLKNIVSVTKILMYELTHTHNRGFYLKNFRANLNMLLYRFSAAAGFEKFIAKDMNSETVFYTYWFSQWTFAMSLIKLKHPQLKLVSRIHGADYNEQQVKRILPFRYFQLQKVNSVFPVSQSGADYMHSVFRYPNEKLNVARLGLSLESKLSPVDAGHLHLVSCSSLIPLKRVHLIIDILKHITVPCTWVHFGDGPLLEDLKLKAKTLPAHCKPEFKGYVPNKKFIEYISQNPVSLFINVSESEGIPVSMMEAITFGIPLVGTNVGGVAEIVTPLTGYLMEADFNPVQTAGVIENMHKKAGIYTQEFRNGILKFYYSTFYTPVNYKALGEKLAQL